MKSNKWIQDVFAAHADSSFEKLAMAKQRSSSDRNRGSEKD